MVNGVGSRFLIGHVRPSPVRLFPSAADQPKPDIVQPATFLEYDGPHGKSALQPARRTGETQKNLTKRLSTCSGATCKKAPKTALHRSQTLAPQGSSFPSARKRKSRCRISTCACRK